MWGITIYLENKYFVTIGLKGPYSGILKEDEAENGALEGPCMLFQ